MNRYIKYMLKFTLSAFVIFVILCFAVYVHELSHATMTEMCGGTCVKMEVFLLEGRTKVKDLDTSSTRIVLVSGSIGAILFGILVIIMGHNFNNITICGGGYMVIQREILYWILSPIEKRGDFYDFIQTHESINIDPIIKLLWFFLVLTFIMLFSSVWKITTNKHINKCRWV